MHRCIATIKKVDIVKNRYFLLAVICGVGLLAGYVWGLGGLDKRAASAAAPDLIAPVVDPFVRGWAWSSNIGWISFDCRDQGVCGSSNYASPIDLTTGKVTGYGWSSNIGWIKMDPAGPYPEAPAHGIQVDMNTGVLSGWARALSNGGGWDGWIKIYDAKVSQGGYIKNAAGTDGGWMWGSNVVGWVKMWMSGNTGATLPVADCAFRADPLTITPPQTITLEWKCNALTTANSCSIDNGIGANMAISGSRSARPTGATTYTLTCQGFGGPVVMTASVSTAPHIKIKEVLPGSL